MNIKNNMIMITKAMLMLKQEIISTEELIINIIGLANSEREKYAPHPL